MPLAFPSGESLPEAREVQFRDGARVIPEHLANLMSGIDTIRYSYDEAVARINDDLVNRHVGRAYDRIIRNHFDRMPR